MEIRSNLQMRSLSLDFTDLLEGARLRSGKSIFDILSIVVVLLLVILSVFDCIDIWFEPRSDIVMQTTVEITKIDSENNCVVIILILAVLELWGILAKMSKLRILLSVLCVLVTMGNIASIAFDLALQMGGLGYHWFSITPIGYIVIVLTIVNLILQIVAHKYSLSPLIEREE